MWECLEPGGLFLFDVDTPKKLEEMDGQVFLDETEDVFCVWRGEYSRKKRICSFWMDIFRREGEVWTRGEELHRERAYTDEELAAFLEEAGFMKIRRHGELRMGPPGEDAYRVFYSVRKGE